MKIDDNLFLQNKPDEKKPAGNSNLGKDDFLKLLITELQNQDPTQPMDDKEFISQMATFSSLEQTQNMSEAINKFVKNQSQNLLSSQSDMIGKQITWEKSSTDADGKNSTDKVENTVAGITLKDGEIKYVTDKGDLVDPGQIDSIWDEDKKKAMT
ncbi:flagellar hook assembly protein FlgD [Scopulibacillus cellulosilyticus]|uniref:Flagellar hook assembly protein FlgD n=1 Tax=Scopulibacillus cellulosilyticus TaxID=2665665 RepID=A0ABW2PT17_9BACL